MGDVNVKIVKKGYNKCPAIRAKENGVYARILIDMGAQASAINKGFIKRHNQPFKKVSILPVAKTQIQTATSVRQSVREQIWVNMSKDNFHMDIAMLIVGNFIYDIIFGIDVLKELDAKINILNNKLICTCGKREVVFELDEWCVSDRYPSKV